MLVVYLSIKSCEEISKFKFKLSFENECVVTICVFAPQLKLKFVQQI